MEKQILDEDPYELLADAIIVQAVNDYKKALIVDENSSKVKMFEKFFRSEWYHVLTNVDGEYIISRVRKEMNL